MIQTKEKQIHGAVYSVTQLPARRALRLKAKLLRLFGPALAHLFLPGAGNRKHVRASLLKDRSRPRRRVFNGSARR